MLAALTVGGSVQAAAVLDGRTLTFGQGGKTAVSLSFPERVGDLSGPLTQGDITWLGVGPVLYGFTAGGVATTRLDFSSTISGFDGSAGVLQVTAGPSGEQDTYTVSGKQIQERVVFVPSPAVTGWLKRFAEQVPEGKLSKPPPWTPPILFWRCAAPRRPARRVSASRR